MLLWLLLWLRLCDAWKEAETVCDMLDEAEPHSDGRWREPNNDEEEATSTVWQPCSATVELHTGGNEFQAKLYCRRKGVDPARLVWRPRSCRLLPLDAVRFFQLIDGHRLELIGDSISRQVFVNLQCAFERAGVLNLTQTYNRLAPLRSHPQLALLDPVTEVESHHTSFLYELIDGALDYSRPERWYHNDRKVIAVINTGAWFNRNKIQLLGVTQVRPADADEWFERTIWQLLDVTLANFHGIVIFRSISPAHEDCGAVQPNNDANVASFAWESFRRRNEFVRGAIRGRPRFYFLDVERLSEPRDDGHPGSLGVSGDCFHWCNPGPTSVLNTWSDALFTLLHQLHEMGVINGSVPKHGVR